MTNNLILEADDLFRKYEEIKRVPVLLEPIITGENIKFDFRDLKLNNKDVSGAIKKDENGVTLFINKYEPRERQRFTVAHELAHYFLDMATSNKPDVHVEFRGLGNPKDLKEIKADSFAANLLMPKDLVEKEYSDLFMPMAYELAEKFQVSVKAMKKRLNDLNLFTVD